MKQPAHAPLAEVYVKVFRQFENLEDKFEMIIFLTSGSDLKLNQIFKKYT